jgi:hypothetical protein
LKCGPAGPGCYGFGAPQDVLIGFSGTRLAPEWDELNGNKRGKTKSKGFEKTREFRSAPFSGRGGRRFKSCHSDQRNQRLSGPLTTLSSARHQLGTSLGPPGANRHQLGTTKPSAHVFGHRRPTGAVSPPGRQWPRDGKRARVWARPANPGPFRPPLLVFGLGFRLDQSISGAGPALAARPVAGPGS